MIQRASIVAVAFSCFLCRPACGLAPVQRNRREQCPGLQSDDVVFLGTVTEVAAVAPTPTAEAADGANEATLQRAAPITRYHFHIDERFAGPDTPDIDVFSGGDDGDCAYNFKKGDQYIVFTQQETEGRLFAVICSGTRPPREGRALLPQLRAMRNHDRVASVFGVLRRADPPLLAPTDDPEDPLPHIKLKLRSKDDRFSTSTGPDGVYSFYDVHAGEYQYTADLPARFEFSQKTLKGGLPPFKIPNGACYEYNVNALPTGKIHGSVLGPDGKPLKIASVELYRAERFEARESRPLELSRRQRQIRIRSHRPRRISARLQSHESHGSEYAFSARFLSRRSRPIRSQNHQSEGWPAASEREHQAQRRLSHAHC